MSKTSQKDIKRVFVRNAYNYDMEEASRLSGLSCSDPTRTDQSFAEECDINTIVRNFGVTGQLPEFSGTPLEGDFTTVVDYQTALNMVIAADNAFAELPATVRERFANDPGRFVEFASNPENAEELKKLGLTNPPPIPPAPIFVKMDPESLTSLTQQSLKTTSQET